MTAFLFIPGVYYTLTLKKIGTFFKVKYIGENIERNTHIFIILEFIYSKNGSSVKYPHKEYELSKEAVSKLFFISEDRSIYFDYSY